MAPWQYYIYIIQVQYNKIIKYKQKQNNILIISNNKKKDIYYNIYLCIYNMYLEIK